jgi:hypothetical protein
MKIALAVPGVGDVPAIFAYDLAQFIGYLASQPAVQVRILTSTDPIDDAVHEELVQAAMEWGADILLFPKTTERLAANTLDAAIDMALAPKIEIVTTLGSQGN